MNKNNKAMMFDLQEKDETIIKVIGVGGGGGNAVQHMFKQGIAGVGFAVSNTDNQALESNEVPFKIRLGQSITSGRGAGSKPEVGKEACIESIDDVRKFLEGDTQMLFVTAGMGGGTGTGAAPIIAKAAKEMGILTVGIVTLPFKFEGMARKRLALEGLNQLKKNVDSILVISNEKIKEIYGDKPLTEAFSHADDVLATAAKGIAEIVTLPGMINTDFADVKTVMENSGVAIMSNGIASGESRAHKVVDMALNSALLEDNDIRGAKAMLLNITYGSEEITMDEVTTITDTIEQEVGLGTFLIWGVGHDENLGENISITLVATGLSEGSIARTKSEQRIVSIDQDDSKDEMFRTEFVDEELSNHNVVIFDDDDVQRTIETLESQTRIAQNTYLLEEEAEEQVRENTRRLAELETKRNKFREQNRKTLDDPTTVNQYENQPAYKRRNAILDELSGNEMEGNSGFTVGVDEEMPLGHSNNSFIHDNVD